MEFDDLLTNYIGPFGKYQAWCTFGYLFCAVPYFLAVIELIYMGKIPDHHCDVKHLGNMISSKWNLSQEDITKITSPPEEFQNHQQCHVVERNWENVNMETIDSLLNNTADTRNITPCDSHVFESQFGITIVETYNLACGSEIMVATAQTGFLLGMLVGVFGFGWLSDRVGRRLSILISLTMAILARVLSVFAPNIWLFSVTRFFNGAGSFGWYTVGFVWGIEITAPKWRPTIALLTTLSFSLTFVICTGFAYITQDWRKMVLYNTCFFAPYLVYYFILPESPRWLYAVGRVNEADKLVHKIAKFNNAKLPEKLEISVKERQEKRTPLVLFKTREMAKRTIANCIVWFSTSLVNYGIILNTVNLVGNIYLNLLIKGAVSALSTPLPMATVNVRWIGRRFTILGAMFLTGVCLILMAFVPTNIPALSITLYMCGSCFAGTVFHCIYLHTPETMPTEVRSMGMSVANVMARVGGLISPYIALLGATSYEDLPSILLGVVALVSGFAILLLPETMGKPLLDTIAEVEADAKKVDNKKFQINGDVDEEKKPLDITAI